MLIDTRIIQRHGALSVLAQRQEVAFYDGSTVHLHPVANAHGERQAFLRALQLEGFRWLLIDLRDLVAQIETDLIGAHDSDRFGIVFYTLRLAFPTSGAFLQMVQARAQVSWWREDVAEQQAAA